MEIKVPEQTIDDYIKYSDVNKGQKNCSGSGKIFKTYLSQNTIPLKKQSLLEIFFNRMRPNN